MRCRVLGSANRSYQLPSPRTISVPLGTDQGSSTPQTLRGTRREHVAAVPCVAAPPALAGSRRRRHNARAGWLARLSPRGVASWLSRDLAEDEARARAPRRPTEAPATRSPSWRACARPRRLAGAAGRARVISAECARRVAAPLQGETRPTPVRICVSTPRSLNGTSSHVHASGTTARGRGVTRETRLVGPSSRLRRINCREHG